MCDSEEPRVRGGYAIVSVHDTASSEWDVGSGGCGVKKDRSRGFVAREAEAYVVNASRGGTVDTAALVDALHFDDLEKIYGHDGACQKDTRRCETSRHMLARFSTILSRSLALTVSSDGWSFSHIHSKKALVTTSHVMSSESQSIPTIVVA